MLLIIRNNNVLASNSVVHHRLVVREKAIEEPIEKTSGDEGVDVSNGKTVEDCQLMTVFTRNLRMTYRFCAP